MRRQFLFALALSIPLASHTNDAFSQCQLRVIQPLREALVQDGGEIALGEADDPVAPKAWQGPLANAHCTLDLGILEGPFIQTNHRSLFVTTYSGSERTLYLVDFEMCAVIWKSVPFTGRVEARRGELKIARRRVALGADCVPRQ